MESAATLGPVSQADDYPVSLDISRPERQRKLTNLPLGIGTFIRLVLLVPSLALLYQLISALWLAYLGATFVILFRGRYPRGLFKLLLGSLRWQTNAYAYFLHLFDEYPPLDLDQRPESKLQLSAPYPEHPSRWLNAPALGLAIKLVLAVPHLIILMALYFLAGVVVFLAAFAILFSGSFPAGLHQMVVGTLRWNVRVTAYLYGFTDRYPPFSLN